MCKHITICVCCINIYFYFLIGLNKNADGLIENANLLSSLIIYLLMLAHLKRQKCSGLPSNVYTQSSAALINASLSDEIKMLLKLF